ncbi:MAG: prepilin-type N-terminal cleavage/methylation domain-containing protein [Nitrospiraceae bacterium]|nr:prepilin-type N-terminal cleavage/methylation domain-containing protein [Nitrospiraceae bacterium]
MRSILSRAIRNSRGLSLLEVLVALAILGIGIVTLIQLYSSSLRSTRKSEDYTRALVYARDVLDEAYAMPGPPEAKTLTLPDGMTAGEQVSAGGSGDNYKAYSITVSVWGVDGRQILELHGKKTVFNENGQ